MKSLQLPLSAKIKIAKYLPNTVNHESTKIFNHENFLSYGMYLLHVGGAFIQVNVYKGQQLLFSAKKITSLKLSNS